MTSKEFVLTIVKEQLINGKNIEDLSRFKMHSDPLVVTEEKNKRGWIYITRIKWLNLLCKNMLWYERRFKLDWEIKYWSN